MSQTHGSAAGAARRTGIPNLITRFICHNLFLNQSGLWRKPSSRAAFTPSRSPRSSGSPDTAPLPRSHSHLRTFLDVKNLFRFQKICQRLSCERRGLTMLWGGGVGGGATMKGKKGSDQPDDDLIILMRS